MASVNFSKFGAALAALSTLPAGTICVLASANPKHPGSLAAARFALYKPGMHVTAYRAACLGTKQVNAKRNAAADLLWDRQHGFINIVPVKAS